MSVLDIYKFKEVAARTERTMPRTRSNVGFLALKGIVQYAKKYELVRGFMPDR